MNDYIVGYEPGQIEPNIAPLVYAVQNAGFITFSSCEGHIDVPFDDNSDPRFTSISFYAHEDEAKCVHGVFLRWRDRLSCSWCLTASFVMHRSLHEFVLGWTMENCGIIEDGTAATLAEFVRLTVEAGRRDDIPLLIQMFEEIGRF
jgi:hypothetical protein